MSGRRSVALPAAVAGAAILFAATGWLLRGEPPPPAASPAPERAEASTIPAAPGPDEAPPAPVPVVGNPPVPDGRPPWATLRLVDAVTREPVRWGSHAALFLLPASRTEAYLPEDVRPGEDGRVLVHSGRREIEDFPGVFTQEEIHGARYLLAIPGYRALEFASRRDLEGEREFALAPSPVSVRGTLTPGRGIERGAVWCQILPADPQEMPARFRPPNPIPPSGFGPFAVHDLPEGRWRLDARIRLADGAFAVASREFAVGEEPADLGEILLRAPVTLAARIVAKDGTPVLDPGLHVGAGGRRFEGLAEEDGWVRFRGLEPGTEVRVASSLPDLEQEIRLPREGGEEVRVELRWEEEGVRCRLRFLVGGMPPTRWGEIFEGPTLDKGAWKRDGFLEHEMAAGEYLFGIWAEPSGKSGMTRVWAKFTVPRQPAWQTDISCSEEMPK